MPPAAAALDYAASKPVIQSFLNDIRLDYLVHLEPGQLNALYSLLDWINPADELRNKTLLLAWIARHFPELKHPVKKMATQTLLTQSMQKKKAFVKKECEGQDWMPDTSRLSGRIRGVREDMHDTSRQYSRIGGVKEDMHDASRRYGQIHGGVEDTHATSRQYSRIRGAMEDMHDAPRQYEEIHGAMEDMHDVSWQHGDIHGDVEDVRDTSRQYGKSHAHGGDRRDTSWQHGKTYGEVEDMRCTSRQHGKTYGAEEQMLDVPMQHGQTQQAPSTPTRNSRQPPRPPQHAQLPTRQSARVSGKMASEVPQWTSYACDLSDVESLAAFSDDIGCASTPDKAEHVHLQAKCQTPPPFFDHEEDGYPDADQMPEIKNHEHQQNNPLGKDTSSASASPQRIPGSLQDGTRPFIPILQNTFFPRICEALRVGHVDTAVLETARLVALVVQIKDVAGEADKQAN
ncbi:hypothetical protein M409DRAFT_29503 [Zasmidium cellare ATCC 36951]|uniref:Uncharacterized protein n=1 Tax=Zasmidium cellare ATCC 36951 TaxID=1080233 RepID=A0A6A6BZK4_ZASCE|nr:uncharacterized protein M409DRAFT_29503 [Zasmidium cellare ATCC 36951]KAF2160053.1 hypothetical protein M409DRAFT_29503 [Zasmidium cellare ATCC 36951]